MFIIVVLISTQISDVFTAQYQCKTNDVRSVSHDMSHDVSHDVSRDITRDHHLMNLQTRSIDDTDTSARD